VCLQDADTRLDVGCLIDTKGKTRKSLVMGYVSGIDFHSIFIIKVQRMLTGKGDGDVTQPLSASSVRPLVTRRSLSETR
jgi:hypothetical protein